MEKKNLPSLLDLYKGDLELVQAENELNLLLNQNTNPKWVKEHPFAKGVKYLSIARIEFLLTSIFINWQVEIRNVQLIANSVVTTIRLHYQDPVTGQMRWQDGLGAAPIQTDKDAGAADFDKVKSDAVMKAAPASETFAVKDAAHKLGNLFGKDLNRRDEIVYDGLAGRFDPTAKLKKLLSDHIGRCQDPETNEAVMGEVLKAEEDGVNDVKFYTELLKKHFDYEVTD